MNIFHWKKSSVFDSTESKESSQTCRLDTLATTVLIYAPKQKSETNLRKMIKIMEESLKIEKKPKKYRYHMRSDPKKETKSKKDT